MADEDTSDDPERGGGQRRERRRSERHRRRVELEAAGVTDTPVVVLADAGYWHQEQMERVVAAGSLVLIPLDSSRRKNTRPGWDGGLYAYMRRVLATDRGAELYARRQQLVEPMFANTKFNRRMDRFRRCGRSAVRTEWRLITATHNFRA